MDFDTNGTQIMVALLTGAVGLYFLRQYFKGGVCHSSVRLDERTVVITGCNTGIGKETALDLAHRGARVVMCCRNLELANRAAEDIRKETMGEVAVYRLDLASLKSIRDCAKDILEKETRIDILINNAGIMMCDEMKTKDGFEMQIGVNHFGHFLFTNLLLDKIKASGPGARIINVSSLAHEHAKGTLDLDDLHFKKRPYNRMTSYRQSKLANVLFTKELARRLEGTGVTTYSLHPGAVYTELSRHVEEKLGTVLKFLIYSVAMFFLKMPKDGAQTTIYCAVEPGIAKESGKYYADCKEKPPLAEANDPVLARKLWEISEKEVGLA